MPRCHEGKGIDCKSLLLRDLQRQIVLREARSHLMISFRTSGPARTIPATPSKVVCLLVREPMLFPAKRNHQAV
jgi:hypothetical protein